MKYLCFNLMFLSKINPVILVAILLFSGFKASVTNDLLCDILLSLIPFWSDYLSSRWMLFPGKLNYSLVNWNHKVQSRCQHNILQIFGETVTFSYFICLKTSGFFCYCFQVTTQSYLFFIHRFIYFKLIKYPANENFISIKNSQKIYSVKRSSFFLLHDHHYFALKPRKTSQYLIKTDFPRGKHVLQNQ